MDYRKNWLKAKVTGRDKKGQYYESETGRIYEPKRDDDAVCAHCGENIWKNPQKHLNEVHNFLLDAAAKLGSLGGIASAKALTPEQRVARAKKAVAKREENRAKRRNKY